MTAVPDRRVVLRGVTRRYGTRTALDGVDLDLGPGVTGLLGRNGAGKTTLMRCLATDLDAGSGEVCLLGLDPTRAPERTDIRRRLGYLPQNPDFYPHFTAFALLDYMAVLKELGGRRARHDEVRRVLRQVGLYDRRHSRVRRLSGGMRQRLALASALMGDPDLLLLDEPTVGLDPEQRIRFRNLVSRLAVDSTVVLSTHQIEDVAALCGHIVCLDRGRVVFDGAPGALLDRARGHVWEGPGDPGSGLTSWRLPDGRHRVLTPGSPLPPGEAFGAVEPTLEDAYLLLVGVSGTEPAGAAR
ncbi:ATP-binding cassette domain-containing protein [Nocardiopsis changdeensis]|uniref:ATP-binding cassette domain-containing protein n=1 Tax=Nocardiopsis changdeensis TaxID=2831969 RepID=A0ABX8BWM6_9ACTN|nr:MULTISPECIES: ATP-binding cassette domain-containing protein [Nocardiopsis]QUX24743.1 ATP-binding cassette domain-containing protein [Nocardiopsis changdeensis]QYX35130.1 ATP-binding cassette domain-containing protein [Nocardiopsis sp. MT53]